MTRPRSDGIALSRLAELGLQLPQVPSPAGSYRPYARIGDSVMTAGQLPLWEGRLHRTGKLGIDVDLDDGIELARIAGLNVLAVLAAASGDLDQVVIVKVNVYVASAPTFTDQHLVANGASDLFASVLEDQGVHARAAVGVASLPMDSPVEVDVVAEISAAWSA
ncbi:MAG: RidA family protein [Nitriliruptoraceae bacterium]